MHRPFAATSLSGRPAVVSSLMVVLYSLVLTFNKSIWPKAESDNSRRELSSVMPFKRPADGISVTRDTLAGFERVLSFLILSPRKSTFHTALVPMAIGVDPVTFAPAT